MKHYINVDLAEVYTDPGKEGKYIKTLAFGDDVEVLEESEKFIKIRTTKFNELKDGSIEPEGKIGYIKLSSKEKSIQVVSKINKVLKVDFVDVQQGDGSVIETPNGKVVLIDGGDNQLFARYLANRYKGTSIDHPKKIDCIVISHGDADHFQGLTEIYKSRFYKSKSKNMDWKKLFIYPLRVYHNGLVKMPGKINKKRVSEKDMFGKTVKKGDEVIITNLVKDIRDVDDSKMNKPFRDWKNALNQFAKHGKISSRRLKKGDDDAFDFLDSDGIKVEVLGPLVTKVNGKEGLPFFGEPKKVPVLRDERLSLDTESFKGLSASHTINGHSIVLKVSYGNISFLFAGDLNDESGRVLTKEHNDKKLSLTSEVFKVPHHGSADYSNAFMDAVNPLISVVSSGDENARKEYIHPRANLIASLGKYSRMDESVVFVTELVAFFETVGFTITEKHKTKDGELVMKDGKPVELKTKKKRFFAFQRTAFGIVKIRTDGQRLLVYTNSGQDRLKEAYAYEIEPDGIVKPISIVKV